MLTYFEKYSKINNHIIYFTRDKILYIDIRINIELPFGGELLGKKQERKNREKYIAVLYSDGSIYCGYYWTAL